MPRPRLCPRVQRRAAAPAGAPRSQTERGAAQLDMQLRRGEGRTCESSVVSKTRNQFARKKGALTQSREDIEDSPAQVFGCRAMLEMICHHDIYTANCFVDRGKVIGADETTLTQ